MQYRSAAPSGVAGAPLPPPPIRGRGPRFRLARTRSRAWVAEPCEVGPVGVEYLVRAARVTDIDRLVALRDASGAVVNDHGSLGSADLMRQLVYLPQATIVVAESQRVVVGGAILALRPSVAAGGFVGTIDLLVADPHHDIDRITAALLEELLRSASNKGCTVVEADRPDDTTLPHWRGIGFAEAAPPHRSNRGRGGIRRASCHLEAPPSCAFAPAGHSTDIKEYQWARTSPSSWTWRTSSMRRRPLGSISTTSPF